MCAGSHATAVIHFVWPVTFTTLIKDIHMHACMHACTANQTQDRAVERATCMDLLDVGDPEIIGFVVMTLTFA